MRKSPAPGLFLSCAGDLHATGAGTSAGQLHCLARAAEDDARQRHGGERETIASAEAISFFVFDI